MRVLVLVEHADVVQLDVEELIDRLEGTDDGQVVLELDSHLLVRQRLEHGEDELYGV